MQKNTKVRHGEKFHGGNIFSRKGQVKKVSHRALS